MTVYFANAGKIDLDVIRVMGVSVKDGDNPIGYFGTGLKFAISTLLRTGHKISLFRGGDEYVFSTKEKSIRGKGFQQVCMNGDPLPFTTELGRNWEVWQAYRELHSNTIDEAGVISDTKKQGDTIFVVEGSGIDREYHNRGDIFVSGSPIAKNDFLEVYEGGGQYIYYRGVRAGVLPDAGMFTYNILSGMELTEDRTLKSQWDVEWKLSTLIPSLENKGLHMQLLSSKGKFDQGLSFTRCGSPSKEFLEAAKANYSNISAPASVRVMVDRDMQEGGTFPLATLTDSGHDKLLSSFGHLKNLGCSLSPEDVEVVESLGPDTMAIYHVQKDQIFLAKSTLDHGLEVVVATLYEEWLHKEYRYEDESRQLQTFLFQRLTALSMGRSAPDPVKQDGGWIF